MRKTLIVLAALASTPALAEMDRGGNVAWYADQVMRWHGPKRIGWFYSATALWLGNPGACVDSGSMVHIHPVTDPVRGRHVPFDNAWNDIIPPTYTFDRVNSYASVMSQTPWGRNVYNAAQRAGCFAHPDGCNFYAQDLVALGVPICR